MGRICLGHRHGTLAIAGAAVTIEGGGVSLGIQGELIGRIAVTGKIRLHMLAHAGGAVAVIHHSSCILCRRQSGVEGTGAVLAAKAHGTVAAHSAGRTFDLAVDIHAHIIAPDAVSSGIDGQQAAALAVIVGLAVGAGPHQRVGTDRHVTVGNDAVGGLAVDRQRAVDHQIQAVIRPELNGTVIGTLVIDDHVAVGIDGQVAAGSHINVAALVVVQSQGAFAGVIDPARAGVIHSSAAFSDHDIAARCSRRNR